jgi:two-component system chemotaxis sensor kinase CheA
MEDLLSDFLAETLESLGQLDTELVNLERQPDNTSALASIFRHVHTIKGTCGFLGLTRLEKVAHAAEDVLGQHRDGTTAVTQASITLILQALDSVRGIVAGIRLTGQEPDGDDGQLIAELNAAANGARAGETGLAEAPAPDTRSSAPIQVPAVAPPAAAPSSPTLAEATISPEQAAQTIRVNVDVLEGLMTLVSELVLARNQIVQLARTQANEAFAAPLQRLSHITSDLQEGVMKTRMQPIGNAWSNLPRLVRDLAHGVGKKIDLVMLGAETELDRQVLELIKDPLTHMVRNSADHGLESIPERRAAGKPEQGVIKLHAFHEGGQIVIEIGDDGRGLPVERIRNKIVANGLATEPELAVMSDQQIQAFIFRPGFSTAAEVTSISGRGVGLDVVKTHLERIGGTVDLTSEPGAGTLFTMKIPLTLAIVSALIVEIGGERFAIPQISVVELVSAQVMGSAGTQSDGQCAETVIEQINDTPVLRLRDQLLPLIALSDLLKLGGGCATTGSLFIVVSQVGATRFGLIVDRVFDTEEIVVKPMAPILRHITMFSGNTILGDGSVIMILDPNGIARATGIVARRAGAAARITAVADPETSEQKIALLLFRAGDAQIKAVPLNLVSRLENVERGTIEYSNGVPLMQYRGKLMPLVDLGASRGRAADPGLQPVLVFADGSRMTGMMVDAIVDVVEDYLHVELATDRSGFLGTAIVQGRATDVLDASFWLQRASKDWFGTNPIARSEPLRLLVVEDSAFFRSLIVPALSTEGYHITAVENPVLALAMRDAGRTFDLILSDIEMPEMDGLTFVREIRAGGSWAALPVLALTSHASPRAIAQGQDAGFDGYISKFDKAVLIAAVRTALSSERAAAKSLHEASSVICGARDVATTAVDALRVLTERLRNTQGDIPGAAPIIVEDVVTAVLESMAERLSPKEATLLREVAGLGRIIDEAKAGIAEVNLDAIRGSHIPTATCELDAVVEHTATATNDILENCEKLEGLQGTLGRSQADVLVHAVTQIYEACSFQDVTGQRITKVVKALQAIEARLLAIAGTYAPQILASEPGNCPRSRDAPASHAGIPLHGPQHPDEAMSQSDIDDLLADFG